MKKSTLYTSLLLLIAFSSASGQVSLPLEGIVSDTVNTSPNKEFESEIGLKSVDASQYDVEIRFYKLKVATNEKILRLIRSKNGNWEAFEIYVNKKTRVKKHMLHPISGIDTFLDKLIKKNFTILPDQVDVEKRIMNSYSSKKDYLQSKPTVYDGYEFTIEFKIQDKFRVYRFANPASYLSYADGYEEIRNYAEIQRIFEQELIKTSAAN